MLKVIWLVVSESSIFAAERSAIQSDAELTAAMVALLEANLRHYAGLADSSPLPRIWKQPAVTRVSP